MALTQEQQSIVTRMQDAVTLLKDNFKHLAGVFVGMRAQADDGGLSEEDCPAEFCTLEVLLKTCFSHQELYDIIGDYNTPTGGDNFEALVALLPDGE